MWEEICHTYETEPSIGKEINELPIELETANRPRLRERVFQTCDYLKSENKKITREIVREITKGSDRDLSKYLKEWRESQNETTVVIQGSNDIDIETSQEVVETIPIKFNPEQYKHDAKIAMLGAKHAAEIMITKEKVAQYFLQNPDKLPDELKQKIAQAQKDTDEILNRWSMKYQAEFCTDIALSSLQKQKE